MLEFIKQAAGVALVPALVAAGGLAFGGPSDPPPLTSIGAAFDAVDFSDLPPLSTFAARDGERIAYRRYDGAADRIVVALHGSSGSSLSLHPLAKAVADAGPTVIAPDISGHGGSGRRGDVDYVGQPSHDLEDLFAMLRAEAPDAEISILGFSMGGGLALRFAAGRDDVENVVLISPYLSHDAEPMKAENPDAPEVAWATAGVGRIAALGALNHIGVTAFNGLATVRLAVRPEDRDVAVDRYSYRMMRSTAPRRWRADLAAVAPRLTLIAGARDGLHLASAYGAAMKEIAPKAAFLVVEDADHMGLTLDPTALAVVASAFEED